MLYEYAFGFKWNCKMCGCFRKKNWRSRTCINIIGLGTLRLVLSAFPCHSLHLFSITSLLLPSPLHWSPLHMLYSFCSLICGRNISTSSRSTFKLSATHIKIVIKIDNKTVETVISRLRKGKRTGKYKRSPNLLNDEETNKLKYEKIMEFWYM